MSSIGQDEHETLETLFRNVDLSHIKSEEAAEHALRYITRATQEEIWFWASKYLGVVDEAIETQRVVEALCILSGAKTTH